MTTGLFGREVEFTFGVPGQAGIQITDLHMAGTVHHKMTGKPSPAKLKIWNPNPLTIQTLQTEGCVITVKIGYRTGGPVRQIFTGNVVRAGVKYDKQGTTGIMEIEAHDGGDAISNSYVNTVFSSQLTYQEAILHVIQSMQVVIGQLVFNGNGSKLFPNGVALVGASRIQLEHLTRSIGCTWNIRDGAMQVLPVGAQTASTAVLFSAAAGNLIGSPSPKAAGADSGNAYPTGSIEVKALAEPSLRPGDAFEVQSSLISGFYIARDVVFEFDNYDEKQFYVVATGAPPGAALVGEGSGSVQTEKPGLGDAIHDSITARLADVHTEMPGQIIDYNPLTQTATVQPTTPQISRDGTTGIYKAILLPPFSGVPVQFPGGASGGMSFPLAAKDPGVLHFMERSTDSWKATGQESDQVQDPARQFHFTDAVFVPGNTSPALALNLDKVSATDLVIWAKVALRLGSAGADEQAMLGNIFEADLGSFLTSQATFTTALAVYTAAVTAAVPALAIPGATFATAITAFEASLASFNTAVGAGTHRSDVVFVEP